MKISRDQLLFVAAVGFPLLGAAVGRYLPGRAGPSPAVAGIALMSRPDAPEDDEKPNLDFTIPKADDSGNSATAKLYRLAHQKQFGRTPLEKAPRFVPTNSVARPVSSAHTPDERVVEAMTTFKNFELTSVLIGRETLAVIGGRPRRVGDVIKSGWKVMSIDTASSSVMLEHEVAGKHKLLIRQHMPRSEDGPAGIEVLRRPGVDPGPTDAPEPAPALPASPR